MRYTLEQARILGGLTQVQMAERLGMSEKTYIQYEKYRKVFRMDDAFRFIRITKVPANSIIFFEGQLQNICSQEVLA
ncbi:helix-turn-helix transcriptional regulator [Bacillus sp. FJAT-49732]|uniref:Helix-turn-helix transcriptional regulator n=1 Tax=Lederbergia citrisecunda TaxID=2833583 RepID=A0A942TK45_9BACI|nr:helix-turn-helix transcriptional regulator [Lederbergia citrisecunda]MBS4198583.1 helix-turn-helix transcriptional regulator [Lederbergia citrisecunda]